MEGSEIATAVVVGVIGFGTRKSWWPVYVDMAASMVSSIKTGFERWGKIGRGVWHGTLLESSCGRARVSETPNHDPRDDVPSADRARSRYVDGEIDERELESRLEEALAEE